MLSRTETLKIEVPEVTGMPEIMPSALRVSPEGREPEARDQEYGGVPPDAARAWL
jgi:hypothetical protein